MKTLKSIPMFMETSKRRKRGWEEGIEVVRAKGILDGIKWANIFMKLGSMVSGF